MMCLKGGEVILQPVGDRHIKCASGVNLTVMFQIAPALLTMRPIEAEGLLQAFDDAEVALGGVVEHLQRGLVVGAVVGRDRLRHVL